MKYKVRPVWMYVPLIVAIIGGFIAGSFAVAIALFGALLMPAIIMIYIPYAKDNPNHVWFKRKLFGWGWTPVTWQGWLITAGYVVLLVAFAFTIDGNSPSSEVAFTFLIPAVLLTVAFLRIAYRKGESPRWQWGEDVGDNAGVNKK